MSHLLYLYGQIGADLFGDGIDAKSIVTEIDSLYSQSVRELEVHINSPGGDVFEGLSIYSAILRFKGRKEIIVDGLAASVASLIAMAGDRITMGEGSEMMIHRPMANAGGTAEDHRKVAAILEQIGTSIEGIYARKTGLSEDRVRELMDAETWMDGAQAVDLGFADRAISGKSAAQALAEDFKPESRWPMVADFKHEKKKEQFLAWMMMCSTTTAPAEPEKGIDMGAENEIKPALEEKIIEAKVSQVVTKDSSSEIVAQASVLPSPRGVFRIGPNAKHRELRAQDLLDRKISMLKDSGRHDELGAAYAARAGLPMGQLGAACLYRHEMCHGMTMQDVCEKLGFISLAEQLQIQNTVAGPMTEGDAAAGGSLVPTDVQAGFIDALDHVVAVRSQIPPGNVIQSRRETLDFGRFTTNFTAEMVTEASSGALGAQGVSTDKITLRARKMRIEGLISRQLIRDADIQFETIISQKMARAAGLKEDLLLVEGTGADNEIKGLKSYGTNVATATATPAFRDAKSDLRKLLKALVTSLVPPDLGRAWIGAGIHREGLAGLEDVNDLYPFERELQAGSLMGYPAGFSTQLNTTGAASCFYLWAPGAAIFMEHLGMMIEADNQYVSSAGTTHSASGRDEVCLRLWRAFDFALTHNEASKYLSTVPWGA